MSDCYWYLKDCDLFAFLDNQEIQRLESESRTRNFKRGEPVYLPNDAADGVLLVVKGRVKICNVTPEGKQSILNFVDAGELFGELSLIGDEERCQFAEAIEPSTIVLIPKLSMLRLMADHPDLSIGITKLIGSRRQRIERRLRNVLFRSNRERVVHLLIEVAERYGTPTAGGTELCVKLSHQEMASTIGSTRETVTVMLGQLQTEGLIRIARRRITIVDLDALFKEVNESVTDDPRRETDGLEEKTGAAALFGNTGQDQRPD